VEDNILVEVLDSILAEVVGSNLEVAVDMEAVEEEEVDAPEVLDDAHDAPPLVVAHVAAQRKKQ